MAKGPNFDRRTFLRHVAGGAAALGGAVVSGITPEEWCATVQLSIQFLEGARRGPLTAEGVLVRRGQRVAFASGEARDSEGLVVARAQGTWHIWPHRPR